VEPLLQGGILPANNGQPCRILTDDLVRYVKTFRGLEYASEESIAGWLYRDIGLSPALWPDGNRFRVGGGGPRGWHFPELKELRAKWETLMGGEWEWHEPMDRWSPCRSPLDRKIEEIEG
jgi:hypothetical protein